jgi:quercetin dioxygenase-like cupin family protein
VKITNLKEIPAEKVEMEGVKDCRYKVALSARDGEMSMAMRFFEVAPGGHTPLHQHGYEHEILIMEGTGTVWRDGQETPLQQGDVLYIPSDEKHQFKNAGQAPFKFMCLIPSKFQKC